MSICLVYITASSMDEARKIANHLLRKRLIVCSNIFSNVASVYRWQGKISEEKEHVIIAKTAENMYEEIKKEVEKIHSYEIPCIFKIPVEANRKYSDWLLKELGK
jgi:periplasmic divalent cation tolerance protein